MMYMSPKTKESFALEYDPNGDSYTKDLDVESLKQIFERIDEKVKKQNLPLHACMLNSTTHCCRNVCRFKIE